MASQSTSRQATIMDFLPVWRMGACTSEVPLSSTRTDFDRPRRVRHQLVWHGVRCQRLDTPFDGKGHCRASRYTGCSSTPRYRSKPKLYRCRVVRKEYRIKQQIRVELGKGYAGRRRRPSFGNLGSSGDRNKARNLDSRPTGSSDTGAETIADSGCDLLQIANALMDIRAESVILPDENQNVVEKDSQDFPVSAL